jgi:hypothetical protein
MIISPAHNTGYLFFTAEIVLRAGRNAGVIERAFYAVCTLAIPGVLPVNAIRIRPRVLDRDQIDALHTVPDEIVKPGYETDPRLYECKSNVARGATD